MAYAVSLADLRRAGLVFSPDEVVAIAEQLIHPRSADAPAAPFGPLAADRIRVASDGSVLCSGCDATPSPAELAIVLQDLLDGTPRVPGGLRYAMARALHEVDAPPFDSLDEFWSSLARFAAPEGEDVVCGLLARWDRRRPAPSTSDLRRQLREADRRLYEVQSRVEPICRVERPVRGWVIAAVLAVVTTIAAASVAGDRAPVLPPVAPPPQADVAPAVSPLEVPTVHARPIVSTASTRAGSPTRPKRPVSHTARTKAIRLNWLHTSIAFKDDLAGQTSR
jgi:hypothetical protein